MQDNNQDVQINLAYFTNPMYGPPLDDRLGYIKYNDPTDIDIKDYQSYIPTYYTTIGNSMAYIDYVGYGLFIIRFAGGDLSGLSTRAFDIDREDRTSFGIDEEVKRCLKLMVKYHHKWAKGIAVYNTGHEVIGLDSSSIALYTKALIISEAHKIVEDCNHVPADVRQKTMEDALLSFAANACDDRGVCKDKIDIQQGIAYAMQIIKRSV